MGLFRKEICPICGQPVKGVINKKIKDNQKLCEECSLKVSMDYSMLAFQTPENIKEHLIYREDNQKLFTTFSTTNEIKCGPAFFREDSRMKKWYFSLEKNPKNPTLFNYDEIVDYELIEDGEQVAKGGIGSAIAGGIMFGSVGAIVGSNIGKKKSLKSMKLRISLTNHYIQQITVDFIPLGMDLKVGSLSYNTYKKEVSNVFSFLDSLRAKATTASASAAQSSTVSSADEILKFKNLLDSGIISQEEFDAKKKQLLGL